MAFQVVYQLPPEFVQVACYKCIQHYLVMASPLFDSCDGILHGSLWGQLARIAAEPGNVICEHCDFNAVWYRQGVVKKSFSMVPRRLLFWQV